MFYYLCILLMFVICSNIVWGVCRHSYMTFCDDLTDIEHHNVEKWTELVIGSESGNSHLRSVNFDSISLDKFDKLTTMIIIGQINNIQSYTFSTDPDHNKLEYLQLYGNDIKRLKYGSFDAITLRKLNLMHNNIEYIHKEAFSNCDIRTIDLSNNNLESVEQNVFSEDLLSNSIKEIVIKHNKLEVIEPNSFPGSLEILNLDYNYLAHLSHDVFDNLHNLQELTLSYNKLTEIPNVKNLKEIQILNFSHNQIIALNAENFNNLTNLEVLDLSYNQISNAIIFKKLQIPQKHPSLQISLAFNRLTYLVIENSTFQHHIVFLYGNPWNCKCWEILEKFMVDNSVKRNKCDLEHFGNGRAPYCINFSGTNCNETFIKKPCLSEKDVEEFLHSIKKQNNLTCSLSPRVL